MPITVHPGGGSGTGAANIVTGPATPPLGSGSAYLATGPNHGDESAQLRNSGDWVGTKLGDLTALSYSTYATASNATPPNVSQDTFFILYVNNSSVSGGADRLFFEPVYSDGVDVVNPNGNQPAPALNTWQNWNLLKGMWYSDNFGGPGSNALTFSTLIADEGAAATISDDTAHGLGGIRFTVGEGSPTDNFAVNVDAFSIGTAAGTTTYNFDPNPAAVPLPATAWGGMALMGLLGVARLVRKPLADGVRA